MMLLRLVPLVVLLGLCAGSSCQPDDVPLLPASESTPIAATDLQLIARFAHITDTHILDEESPARFSEAHDFSSSAWRPWENCSTQILDGIVRTTNRIHGSGRQIDFVLHTGDTCDNSQSNELAWFVALMDGGEVNPLSGPDDRPPESRPERNLDPHAAFAAAGLYRQGVHGSLATIPWYVLLGNHDRYAIGVFPIQDTIWGDRIATLPLALRPGIWVPRTLNPTGGLAYGSVTPANPGPPELFESPVPVVPSSARAYFAPETFVAEMIASPTSPRGHGFASGAGPWYSVTPVAGLRLLGLYTSDQLDLAPGRPYHEGCISTGQLAWLSDELESADARGELVVVATHHPSGSLEVLYGTAADPGEFRALLTRHPCVVLHVAGHNHRNRVADRGGYIEIETCSTIDWPQEARLVEIWRDRATGELSVAYEMYSHVDERWPSLGEDPLCGLRAQALELCRQNQPAATLRSANTPGLPEDRQGSMPLRRIAAGRPG